MDAKSQLSEEGGTKEQIASEVDSGTEKRPGVFVRISPMAKEVLEIAAVGFSYGKVIERLLEYFDQQDPDFKNDILNGVYINPLRKSQDLIARLHRAQHAFENKRYYYAIETYLLVANTLGRDSSGELLDVCNYRIGHSLKRWSSQLRVEALSHLSSDFSPEEDFVLARKVLDLALRFLGKVKNGDPFTELVSHYNRACCYALKAQYLVESKLDLLTRDKLNSAEVNGDKPAMQEVWKDIGDTWRLKNNDLTPDQMAQEALQQLRQVYSNSALEHSQSSLISGRTWLVDISKNDEDFTFMRWDRDWKSKFNDWRNSLQRNNAMKAVEPILQKCEQLLDKF